jgi:hypothetical protein
MKPSAAQGAAFVQFEAAYYDQRDGTTQETLVADVQAARAAHPALFHGKKKSQFSATSYHSWRRQETSPTVHDLELLAIAAGRCLTLLLQDLDTRSGVDEMSERLEEVIERLRAMPVESQLVLAGKIEDAIEKESARHPTVADAHPAARARR